jgi:Kelch motif
MVGIRTHLHAVRSWRLPVLVAASVAVVLAIATVVFFVAGGGGKNDGAAGGGDRSSTPSAPTAPGQSTVTSPTPSSPSTPSPSTPQPTTPTATGTWQRLPAAPVPARFQGPAVWTGKELVIYGPYYYAEGSRLRSVGAAYNPASNTWRPLPLTPDPPEMREGNQVAVWTGKEMLTWGQVDAAYNPKTNTWRRLPPGWEAPSVAVWTGRQALLWGGGCCGGVLRNGVAIDPVTGARRAIPNGPFGGPDTQGVWTGREMIVVGGSGDRGPLALAAAYNPASRTWRSLPSMPGSRAGATVTWTGGEVLVVGGLDPYADKVQSGGFAYNPVTNQWRRLPAMQFPRWNHVAVWTGKQLLVWGGRSDAGLQSVYPASGVAYDPTRDRWSALPQSPLRGRDDSVAVWTGTRMIVWGGVAQSGVLTDGAAFRP